MVVVKVVVKVGDKIGWKYGSGSGGETGVRGVLIIRQIGPVFANPFYDARWRCKRSAS